MLQLFLFWGCTAKESQVPKNTNTSNPIEDTIQQNLSPNQMWDLPQSSEEWWSGIDQLSNTYAGAGVLIEDINGDNLLDLILLRRNGNRLLLQQTDGWLEEDLPEIEGIASNGSIVDFDADGDQDIVLNTLGGPDLFLIQENNSWSVQELPSPRFSAGSSWYDINKDGLLDLSIAGYGDDHDPALGDALNSGTPFSGQENHLFLQTADHQLIEADLLPELDVHSFTFNLAWLPINTDQYWDLFSVNDFGMINGGHQVFWNQAGETFALSEESLGLAHEMFGMGLAVADINHDQRPDLSITNIGSMVSLLSDNGIWYDSALNFGFEATEERHTSWGIDWGDINNDGHLDLWVGYGPLPINGDPDFYNPSDQPDALFLWTENGYQDVSSSWGIDRLSNTRAGGFADLDRDGCLELIRVAIDGEAEIFRGQCANNWLSIRLDDGNNGIGSQIEVIGEENSQTDWMMAGGTSFAIFFPLETHFGLGSQSMVDIIVTWTDGTEQQLTSISANQNLVITKE